MTPRPTPGSRYPWTRGDLERIADVSFVTIKSLLKGRLLKKRRRGAGHHIGYDDDDALRIMLANVLLGHGLNVAGLPSLFSSIEQPPDHPSAKTWAWLRTRDAYDEGAALVLLRPQPRDPNLTTGHAYLTTAADAVQWLERPRVSVAVTVIDVGALIVQLEAQTGRPYGQRPPNSASPIA